MRRRVVVDLDNLATIKVAGLIVILGRGLLDL